MTFGWVRAARPGSFWDVVGHHGLWAVLSGAALASVTVLPLRCWPVIPCWFRELLHRPCPFCGLTRSVSAAGHGRWAESWHHAPLGVFLLALLAAFFAWHAAGLFTRRVLKWQGPRVRGKTMLWTGTCVVLAHWAYRWGAGLDR